MNQDENQVDDWRLQTIAHLAKDWENPWTGQLVLEGTRITVSTIIPLSNKRQLTIPLPNATALFLSASERAYIQAKQIRKENEIDQTRHHDVSFKSDALAFEYLEHIIESIILAFTAIEAFVNESIPVDYKYVHTKKSEIILEESDKRHIERHISIDEKISKVLPDILNCSSPKTSSCWGKYLELRRVRDRIIHMKSEDRVSSGPFNKTIWSALFVTPSPTVTAKNLIDYFLRHMEETPLWSRKYSTRITADAHLKNN